MHEKTARVEQSEKGEGGGKRHGGLPCKLNADSVYDFLCMCVIKGGRKAKDEKWREINREKLAEAVVSLGGEWCCMVTAQPLPRNSE